MHKKRRVYESEILEHICRYIDYLEREHGLAVTLHHPNGDLEDFGSKIVSHNIHSNEYCKYIKMHPALRAWCIRNQTPVTQKCMERGRYFSCCFAGVYEYVYSFKNSGGEIIGFISVSGYRKDFKHLPMRLARLAEDHSLDVRRLTELYMNGLSTDIPSMEKMDCLIFPLSDMLELLMVRTIGARSKDKSSKYLAYTKILLYLRRNYNKNISLESLSEELHYSKSYISHLFKTFHGSTIKYCVNYIRVEYARNLLINTDYPVSQIAFDLGYMDANYFTKVYKSITGKSPMEERNGRVR